MDFLINVLSPSNILAFLQMTSLASYVLGTITALMTTWFLYYLAGSWIHDVFDLQPDLELESSHGCGFVTVGLSMVFFLLWMVSYPDLQWWVYLTLVPLLSIIVSRVSDHGLLKQRAERRAHEKKWTDKQVRKDLKSALAEIDDLAGDHWTDVRDCLERVPYQLERLLYARRLSSGAIDALEKELRLVSDEKRHEQLASVRDDIDARYSEAVRCVCMFIHFIDDVEHALRAGKLGVHDAEDAQALFIKGFQDNVTAISRLMSPDMEAEFKKEWQQRHEEPKQLAEQLPDNLAAPMEPDEELCPARQAAEDEVEGMGTELNEKLRRIAAKAAKQVK